MDRIALKGIGPLTPIGIGKKQFWNAVQEGISGIKRLTKHSVLSKYYGGEITGIDFDEHISGKRFRRAADLSKYTMLAVKLAMDDADSSCADGTDTGIVVGLTHGALNYSQSYHRSLITDGVQSASPILFSDSVLNAPAGNVSIFLGIHGPTHTLIGGNTIGLRTVIFAIEMMNTGRIDKAVIASAEELNELSFLCNSRLGLNKLSEGAGALVIEREATMNSNGSYCFISGYASCVCPSRPGDAVSGAIEDSLEMAGLSYNEIDFVMLDSTLPGIFEQQLSLLPSGSVVPLAGNAFSVNSIWNIILSALLIKYKEVPVSVMNNKKGVLSEIRNIMVCAVEDNGVVSVIILSDKL
ncbi:MAG: hypothetical protein GY941_29545 [Planctomycetes bacterium]|nr:hypothetical protein [Planctomycetota bacterium]